MALRGRARRLRAATATMAVILLALLEGCSSAPGPSDTLGRYLAAWTRGDYAAMAALVARPPKDFVAFNRRVAADLDLVGGVYRAGPVTTSGSDATVSVRSHLVLTPFRPLDVRTTVRLTDVAGRWRVLWSPRSIVSALGPGDSVSTVVSWPPRADILGAGGAPLTVGRPP